METNPIGRYGEVESTRWLLTIPPGHVLGRIARETGRDRVVARMQDHGFRLFVSSIWRNNPSPELVGNVAPNEYGSELQFRVQFPFGPLLWLLPTLMLGPTAGAILGVTGVLVFQSSGNGASTILGGALCGALPLGLWVIVLTISDAGLRGKSNQLLRFLEESLGNARLLDVEPTGARHEGKSPTPRLSGWSRRLLVVLLAILGGIPLGAMAMLIAEQDAEHTRNVVSGVREADPKKVARITFSPSKNSPFPEPIEVTRPEIIATICDELQGGTKDHLGKSERYEWVYTLTLEWDDGHQSRCEILKKDKGIFLRVLDHRGEHVSSGSGVFRLAPEAKLLIEPHRLTE